MSNGITPDINDWTHPRTGQVRRYINNWAELAGIEVERHGTGNLRGVYITPSPCDDIEGGISNRQAGRILGGKAWLDANGELHMSGHGCNGISREQLRARIVYGLRAAGIEAR